jgi:two-component system, LytTR family, response regulator
MLKIMIVDDEPLAIENLRCLLVNYEHIHIVAECPNAIEAIRMMHHLRPDVVFLDIQMPRINGFEMLSMIDPDSMPTIIFLTAYDHYAIKAFEEQAFDYLLKPIDPQRLDKTLRRLQQNPIRQDIQSLPMIYDHPLQYIPCLGHSRIYLLNVEHVLYVSSSVQGNRVISQEGSEYSTELTLRTLEERTPLIRCHRQYLINITKLKEIRFNINHQADVIVTNGDAVPISRRYFKILKERLSL